MHFSKHYIPTSVNRCGIVSPHNDAFCPIHQSIIAGIVLTIYIPLHLFFPAAFGSYHRVGRTFVSPLCVAATPLPDQLEASVSCSSADQGTIADMLSRHNTYCSFIIAQDNTLYNSIPKDFEQMFRYT